ncbi:MAG: VWA domain-containing protein [Flavobacteriaceae bacterium]|nr:VWA domain-containing protein [Flavobacteriaceae bacterium]
MLILEEKIWFYLLFALPLFALLFLFYYYQKNKKLSQYALPKPLKKLAPERSFFKPILKFVFLSLAIVSVVFALVNLKMGTKIETVKRQGIDLVFAVDVSKSMLAEDIAPNRLEKAKQIVRQIINNLQSDRIGIIAYAASAFPQLPMTTDYNAAKMFLQSMNTEMLSSQGTAIAEAIDLAKSFYNDEEQKNRILIVLSDGEDHGGDIEIALDQAKKSNIKIVTIGLGKPTGAPIPIKDKNNVVKEFKKDQNNETVITKLDVETLTSIAENTNGIYLDGVNTKLVLDKIQQLLEETEKKEYETQQFADFADQFQWFLALGLFFLVLEAFVLDKKTAWIQKLNLFGERHEKE